MHSARNFAPASWCSNIFAPLPKEFPIPIVSRFIFEFSFTFVLHLCTPHFRLCGGRRGDKFACGKHSMTSEEARRTPRSIWPQFMLAWGSGRVGGDFTRRTFYLKCRPLKEFAFLLVNTFKKTKAIT